MLMLAAGLAGCATPATPTAPATALPTTPATTPATATAPREVTPIAPEGPSGWTPKRVVRAPHDMIAAAHPLAVRAGADALARGGSAVDAAIVAQMVLNVVEPQSSGIGGGGFMLHLDGRRGTLAAYDGRETAPATADASLFLGPDGRPLPYFDLVDSGLSVGAPGLLRMLELAHARHGRLPWPALFEPAIRIAEEGFQVSPRLHLSIARSVRRICARPAAAALLLEPGGCRPKAAGSIMRNPELARSFREIAAGGADAFYRGPIAQAVAAAVHAHPERPGRLTEADLAGYRALERAPICGAHRAHRVCGMPPPSSGGIAVLQTLGILQRFDLAAHAPGSLDAVHLVSEAYRLAYADRERHVADADFVAVPVAGLLDPAYLGARSALVRPEASMGIPAAGRPQGDAGHGEEPPRQRPPSTTHLSIVDREGNAVSMTSSIEHAFGSLVMAGGFLLNNQLTDFAFAAADPAGRPLANRIQPGKRPRSAMAPTLVFGPDNRLEAVLGSPGGSVIVQYVTKALLGLIDWKLDPQQAVDLPNFGAQASATTLLERGTSLEALAPGLRARGHRVTIVDLNSGLHAIARDGEGWAGGADPRREGTAMGSTRREGSAMGSWQREGVAHGDALR
ncbi:gamma-glutamyltransferase [Quisquiliibacterium transsilvanicum]